MQRTLPALAVAASVHGPDIPCSFAIATAGSAADLWDECVTTFIHESDGLQRH